MRMSELEDKNRKENLTIGANQTREQVEEDRREPNYLMLCGYPMFTKQAKLLRQRLDLLLHFGFITAD